MDLMAISKDTSTSYFLNFYIFKHLLDKLELFFMANESQS